MAITSDPLKVEVQMIEESSSDEDVALAHCSLKPVSKSMTFENIRLKRTKDNYLRGYENFVTWQSENNEKSLSENVLMMYFNELSKLKQPPSLWSIYSILKCTLKYKHSIDLNDYTKLRSFLKNQAVGYKSKQSKVFTAQQVQTFLKEAPNKTYLLMKVTLIFGICGACAFTELTNITVGDVEKQGKLLIVKIPNNRSFVVNDEFTKFVEKYRNLRPKVLTNRFFLKYSNGKCSQQVLGRNKFTNIPKEIAKYLKLPNTELYTGHCFRRTSKKLLNDSGVDLATIKRHGSRKRNTLWKFTSFATGSLKDSNENSKITSKGTKLNGENSSLWSEKGSLKDKQRQTKVNGRREIRKSVGTKTPEVMKILNKPKINKIESNEFDICRSPVVEYIDCTLDLEVSGNGVDFTARGLMPPVFTPINEDQTINYSIIPSYAQYLARNGIKSVLVGGTTGENMSLSVEDRKKLVTEWVKVGKTTGLHIQVQVGGAPLVDVLNLASFCQSAGADSLLTLPELYFKPASVSDLVFYVELVAKAAPNLPVLYYHIPNMTKVEINMPAFVTEATARIPNFRGIKFTSNDLSEGAQVLRNLKKGQEIFLGADTLLAPAALLGIKSSIGTSFNLFPRLAQEILVAVERSDIPTARALQEKLSIAVEAHTAEGAWVPVMKAGMEIVSGIKIGPPSLPQRPISEESMKRIEGKLKSLGLCQ